MLRLKIVDGDDIAVNPNHVVSVLTQTDERCLIVLSTNDVYEIVMAAKTLIDIMDLSFPRQDPPKSL